MDSGLKQRLIGAAVLIALAVIFLPMLVKGPAPESGVADVPLRVPDAPEGQFVTRELPLVRPGATGESGALGMPRPVAADNIANNDAPASGERLPAATAAGRFAVHFGAYASDEDAKLVQAPLLQAGLPGYIEQTRVGQRQAWRVRIGPFATRAEAEAARVAANRVRDDVGARVVTLDADGAAEQATASAQPQPPQAQPSPAPAQTAAAPKPTPAPTPAPPAAATQPPPAATAAKPEPTPAPAPEPKPAAPTPPAAPAPAPAASDVGFAVQLGAFGNAEEANRLRDRARAAGFSAFTEQVRGEAGPLTRVRIGPVATRAEAEQLKARADARLGGNGMVRQHP